MPVTELVLRDLDGGIEAMPEPRLNHRGSLTVAATSLLTANFLPGVCAEMRRRFPALCPHVHGRLRRNLQSVRAGEADLPIGSSGRR